MRIKGGSSHVGAIKNLLYRDGVVVSFANQGVEGIAQKLLCPCDPTIWHLGYLDGHFFPPGAVLTDKMPVLSANACFRSLCSSLLPRLKLRLDFGQLSTFIRLFEKCRA